MKKFITISFLALILIIPVGCSKTKVDMDMEQDGENVTEEQRLNESINLFDKLENSENKKVTSGQVRGSCNAIGESSTCIEYYGSFWNEQKIKLLCSDSDVFSTEECPTNMSGGCNTGIGTPSDMVTWMYTKGGGGITTKSLKYAKMACDAAAASKWLNSKR
jgi:hypothetical protein